MGPNSSFFFRALKIDTGFLGEPPADWPSIPSYVRAQEKVHSVKVVNDIAERMVKMAADFIPRAKDEDNYQDYLQVVLKCRQDLPNLRAKKDIVSKWASQTP